MSKNISVKRIKEIARETKSLPYKDLRLYVMADGSTTEQNQGFSGFTNSDSDVRWLTYFSVPATVEEVAHSIREAEHYY
jgi:endo-1,4-beta-mannosidase